MRSQHGGARRSSSWNCSLGGVCTNSAFRSPAISGPSCALLNLAPAEQANGLPIANFSSWGGGVQPLRAASRRLARTQPDSREFDKVYRQNHRA